MLECHGTVPKMCNQWDKAPFAVRGGPPTVACVQICHKPDGITVLLSCRRKKGGSIEPDRRVVSLRELHQAGTLEDAHIPPESQYIYVIYIPIAQSTSFVLFYVVGPISCFPLLASKIARRYYTRVGRYRAQ